VDTCLEEISEDVLEKFTRWGSTGSEAMLDYPCSIFQINDSEGFIAYRIVSDTIIVFGDPVCPKNDISFLLDAFHNFCQELGHHVIYLIVSEEFASQLNAKYCKVAIVACDELIINPTAPDRSKRLHYRLNQAVKHGLVFHEYIPYDESTEADILKVGKEWKERKTGPQIHLGHLRFFENRNGKRWFYIRENNEITAMAMLVRLESRDGWLLKFLFVKPTAIKYTSEFLVWEIIKTLQAEDCTFLTFGIVPVESLDRVKGLGPFSKWLTKIIFSLIKKVFRLDQKKIYWQRYRPQKEPTYVLFSKSTIGINGIKALIQAMRTDYL